MFDTSIIEVVVGLVFVFSLLAILVTQINGIITTLLNLRAKHLKAGLVDLITDREIRAKLLAHPIINMVKATVTTDATLSAQQAEDIARIPETQLTYIPPQTFVEALIGILISESNNKLFTPLQDAVRGITSGPSKSRLRELIGRISTTYSEATLREIYEVADTLENQEECDQIRNALVAVQESIQQLYLRSEELIPLMQGISNIHDVRFQNALRTVLAASKNLEEARVKMEYWFNDNMQRVTEKFKRDMQRYSFVVAAVMVLVLNVDSLFVARSLWEDDALRAAVAAAAEDFEQPQPSTTPTPPTGEDGETDLSQQLQQQGQETRETLQTLLNLQLPIGWQITTVTDEMVQNSLALGMQDPRANPRNLWNFVPGNSNQWASLWLQKLIGMVITVIAAAQGAPFWFDLLNRLTRR
jgi:hypothetical protein